MFAVVKIGGKQYKVAPNDVVEVEHLDADVGKTVTFDTVLLMEKDGKVDVGTPAVKGAAVKAKVLEQTRGKKLTVRRFKSKVRHRRTVGFRQQITRLQIVSVGRT